MKVSDVIKIMADMAPPYLAEDWDNSGLQFGSPARDVKNVFVALEPSLEAVHAAVRAGADMLITHHPLIFKPLSVIDTDSPIGAVIETAARNRLAVFAAHTNLDSAAGGVNDVLCQKIGLRDLSVLCPASGPRQYKVVVFVPEDHTAKLIDAVCQSPAGRIGNYSCCTFRSPGTGTFVPGPGADPYDGVIGNLSEASEVRMETVVEKADLEAVIAHLKAHHPYETMAYDVYPLEPEAAGQGLGRIGRVTPQMTLGELARDLKNRLELPWVRFSGPADLAVDCAAVCSGSGGGLLTAFFASPAQVLITGDLRYHDAVDAVQRGRGLIDIGHFASEHIVVDVICSRIRDAVHAAGGSVDVNVFDREADPFVHV